MSNYTREASYERGNAVQAEGVGFFARRERRATRRRAEPQSSCVGTAVGFLASTVGTPVGLHSVVGTAVGFSSVVGTAVGARSEVGTPVAACGRSSAPRSACGGR